MPLSNPITSGSIIALWSGTPDGTMFLDDSGALSAPSFNTLFPVVAPGDVIVAKPGLPGGDPYWDVLPVGSDDDVLTLVSGAPAWAAPAGGGGYPYLTNPERGIFLIYDPTATTGESQLSIREGADTTGYNAVLAIQNHAGDEVWKVGGINNTFNQQSQGAYLDWYGQGYYISASTGVKVSGDREFSLSNTANNVYAAADVRFKRAGAGVATFLDDAGALCDLEIGAVFIDDGAVLRQVLFGANGTGPGGTGRALYIADA